VPNAAVSDEETEPEDGARSAMTPICRRRSVMAEELGPGMSGFWFANMAGSFTQDLAIETLQGMLRAGVDVFYGNSCAWFQELGVLLVLDDWLSVLILYPEL
jgi:hypothetical protein